MKRLLISLLFLFSILALSVLTTTVFGQTLGNTKINVRTLPPTGCQEGPICSLTDDCFAVDLLLQKFKAMVPVS